MPTLLEHPANPDGRGAEAAEAPSIWRTPLFQSLLAADTVTHFVFDQRTVGQIGRNPTCILGCSTPSLRATLSSFGRAGQCNHPGGHPPLGEGGSRTFSRRLPRPTRHACVMRWRKCSSSLGRQRGSHLKRLVRHCPPMFPLFFVGGECCLHRTWRSPPAYAMYPFHPDVRDARCGLEKKRVQPMCKPVAARMSLPSLSERAAGGRHEPRE